ncbi:DedA family protein [Flexivirga meconopsidis]|uniref:DedA family protein n=1 Tax=Flexivirga meconopsidis TaxID=2977121 RepID=UPI00223F8AA9|nr:DedA family protein [Flexivirga meconopsidis]
MSFIEGLMDSWAVYPMLTAISFIDALIPVIPSEAPIIMAGVYSGSTGRPIAPLVVLAAFIGAFIGDHVTYFIGRRFSGMIDRTRPDSRRGRVLASTRELLDRRGPTALIVARFIPWGRIGVNLLMGATGTPLRKYSPYDAIGVLIWAVYGVAVGYLGGSAFENNPLAGLVLGLGVAMVFTLIVEWVRPRLARRRERRARQRADEPAKPAGDQPEGSAAAPSSLARAPSHHE